MADIEVSAQSAESVDISQRDDVQKLRKHSAGLAGVLFLTVTGSAPISAMLFLTPIIVGYGNGFGAPAAYAAITILLIVFAVGYVAMARKKTTAGGFYSFISHGMGRELGLASGFAIVVAYSVFEAALAAGFAYFLELKLAVYGVTGIQWPWLALGMILVLGILAYMDVRISMVVLGLGLVTEVLVLLILDFTVFARAGSRLPVTSAIGILQAFKGHSAIGKLAAGSAGIGLFFAFWSWVGFEMAPNYGEESRNPKRIVPLAMYISVIGLGIFYFLSSWAPLAGFGSLQAAVAHAQSDPGTFYQPASTQYVSPYLWDAMSYLILTGSFACGMAFHNTASRYFYSLGRESLLPRYLGKTHKTWKSPARASVTQSVIAAFIIALFAIFAGTDNPLTQGYLQAFSGMSIMGVMIILAIQALVSVAIVIYFERNHRDEAHWWKTRLAPAISFLGQAGLLYLLIKNLAFIGGGFGYFNLFAPIDLAIFLVGLGMAFYWRVSSREKYATIGRMVHEDL
jgi:amino acid transporter